MKQQLTGTTNRALQFPLTESPNDSMVSQGRLTGRGQDQRKKRFRRQIIQPAFLLKSHRSTVSELGQILGQARTVPCLVSECVVDPLVEMEIKAKARIYMERKLIRK